MFYQIDIILPSYEIKEIVFIFFFIMLIYSQILLKITLVMIHETHFIMYSISF